jgi:transcriptional regulator with XRE-family HTH domain
VAARRFGYVDTRLGRFSDAQVHYQHRADLVGGGHVGAHTVVGDVVDQLGVHAAGCDVRDPHALRAQFHAQVPAEVRDERLRGGVHSELREQVLRGDRRGVDQVCRPTPGLRREEVAALAGVSVDYIAKLEQCRIGNVSDQVLDAISDALRLDELERKHLRALAAPKSLLLAPEARTRYVEWEAVAATTVASLRASHDPRTPDETLERLVGELSVASAEFATYWADYRLFKHTHGRKKFFHETVGGFTLNYDTLDIPDSGGQILCAYTPDPGSPSEEKLALLLSWAASADPASAPAAADPAEQRGPASF